MTAFSDTPEADRPHRSRECKNHEHRNCGGYYDHGGAQTGMDTYRCLCACHVPAGGEA